MSSPVVNTLILLAMCLACWAVLLPSLPLLAVRRVPTKLITGRTLLDVPLDELATMAAAAHPGVWAETALGYSNAAFHWEWYDLLLAEQRLALVAPRDHAKSSCVTVNYSTWRMVHTPGFQVYVFAATAELAAKLLKRVRDTVEQAAPDLLGADVDNATELWLTNGSRVSCAGTGKSIRGAHPDLIVGDDVLDEDSSLTALQRKRVERWWFGSVSGMAHPGTERIVGGQRFWFRPTQIVIVGTPFHSSDLLSGMRDNPLYAFYRFAAEFDPLALPRAGSLAVEIA